MILEGEIYISLVVKMCLNKTEYFDYSLKMNNIVGVGVHTRSYFFSDHLPNVVGI